MIRRNSLVNRQTLLEDRVRINSLCPEQVRHLFFQLFLPVEIQGGSEGFQHRLTLSRSEPAGAFANELTPRRRLQLRQQGDLFIIHLAQGRSQSLAALAGNRVAREEQAAVTTEVLGRESLQSARRELLRQRRLEFSQHSGYRQIPQRTRLSGFIDLRECLAGISALALDSEAGLPHKGPRPGACGKQFIAAPEKPAHNQADEV